MNKDEFSRTGKLFMDRDKLTEEETRAKRENHCITFVLGEDTAGSAGLQTSVATALNLASRVFAGEVNLLAPASVYESPCLIPINNKKSFGAFLEELMPERLSIVDEAIGQILCFGNCDQLTGLRVTFDGWIAKVGPTNVLPRQKERHWCPLAPILAAALAIGECFLDFHELSLQAGSRILDVSLWNPLSEDFEQRLGQQVTHAPKHISIVGLGHLGQAYIWALAALDYEIPEEVILWLLDDDRVTPANRETSVLVGLGDTGKLKTRVIDAFCQRVGFETRLIERRIDEAYRRSSQEPKIVLSGVDSNEVRHWISHAGFSLMFDAGLGDSAENFDHIGLRGWPHVRTADDLWPIPTKADREEATRAAHEKFRDNPGYHALALHDCGLVELMGVAIGVPYVGTVASTYVVASLLKSAMFGPKTGPGRISLGVEPNRYLGSMEASYSAENCSVSMPLGRLRCAAVKQ